MRKFKKMFVRKKNGWCEWVFPKVGSFFLFKCCDCGLIHELDFKTFVERRPHRGAMFEAIELPKQIRAMFRARRMKIPQSLKKLNVIIT